jgi:hypothetical protein
MDRRKCSELGHWRNHMRRRRKPCQSSLFTGGDASLLVISQPNGQNGGEPRHPVARVAKPYKLHAALSSRCEDSLRW